MISEQIKLEFDFLDFPTAWAIQKRGGLTHHPKCSSVPGWHPFSGPGFLCDCNAVVREWERLMDEAGKPIRERCDAPEKLTGETR